MQPDTLKTVNKKKRQKGKPKESVVDNNTKNKGFKFNDAATVSDDKNEEEMMVPMKVLSSSNLVTTKDIIASPLFKPNE
jgi:hypothetical protein